MFPESAPAEAGFESAMNWFNFGLATVDRQGRFTIEIVSAAGLTLYDFSLSPDS